MKTVHTADDIGKAYGVFCEAITKIEGLGFAQNQAAQMLFSLSAALLAAIKPETVTPQELFTRMELAVRDAITNGAAEIIKQSELDRKGLQ